MEGPGALLTYGERETARTNDANRRGTLLLRCLSPPALKPLADKLGKC